MLYLSTGILFLVGIFCLWARRDFFYPAVLVSFIYTCVFMLYMATEDIYTYDLSDSVIIFICGMVFNFTIASFLGDIVAKKLSLCVYSNDAYGECFSKQRIARFGRYVLIFSFCYILSRMSEYTLGMNIINYLNTIRNADVESTVRDPVAYLQPFLLISWAMFFYSNHNSSYKVSKFYFIIIAMIFSMALLLNTGKQIFFMAIISTAFIFGIKKIKQVALIGVLIVALFSGFMLALRGLDGSLLFYLSMYMVSPTVAFQQFYYNVDHSVIGSNLLWFFNRVGEIFSSAKPNERIHKPFVYVGLATNVYTSFSEYYYYSSYLCSVLIFVQGFILGVLWRIAKYSWKAKVFLSYFLYTAIFIFYHESFIVNFSSWVQMIIALFVVNFLSKVGVKK